MKEGSTTERESQSRLRILLGFTMKEETNSGTPAAALYTSKKWTGGGETLGNKNLNSFIKPAEEDRGIRQLELPLVLTRLQQREHNDSTRKQRDTETHAWGQEYAVKTTRNWNFLPVMMCTVIICDTEQKQRAQRTEHVKIKKKRVQR